MRLDSVCPTDACAMQPATVLCGATRGPVAGKRRRHAPPATTERAHSADAKASKDAASKASE
eukprot:7732478-Alexandrium_andersonii.AAC.1